MMQAMIFAAGLGTRLKPLTESIPKALVEVGGETLLQRTIERLKACGVKSMVINVHHFAQAIVDYLQTNNNFGVEIIVSDETQHLLDTGGGLKKAAHLFSSTANILIHNVDIISNVDLQAFYTHQGKSDALLLVSQRETKRYLLFNDDMRLVGWTNVETGEVRTPYPNLNPQTCKKLAFAGIHSFSPKLFEKMEKYPAKFGIIDFYLDQCADNDIRGYEQEGLQLLDVGKLNTLERLPKPTADNPSVSDVDILRHLHAQ